MTIINMVKTGNRIKELRKSKNIKLKEIQERFGFNTPQAIIKWQNGVNLPTIDNLVTLCDIFDTEITDILILEKV